MPLTPYYNKDGGRYGTGESYDVFYGYEDNSQIHTSSDELWTYAFVEGGVELLRYNSNEIDIVVPALVDGHRVVSLDSTFDGFRELKRVAIPRGVTSIEGAFYGCEGLEEVSLPDGLVNITYGFHCCYALKALTVPQSVTNFSSAFGGTQLTSFIFPPGAEQISHAFFNSEQLRSVYIPKSVTASSEAFCDCELLTEVTLENGLTSLDDWALFHCLSLKELTIPPSVTKFGKMAVGFMENREYTSPRKTAFQIKGHQIVPGFIIKGAAGSAAQAYANQHKIPFYPVSFCS